MTSMAEAGQFGLGLDIGANSVGWALVRLQKGRPAGLARSGVRVFAAGVEGTIETGKDSSRAVPRREARLRRRMLARRRMRLNKLAALLQGAGLLPARDLSSPDALMKFFSDLDRALFAEVRGGADSHVHLYRLRARALDEPLSPHELGRALYHLAQRRGFLSNRKFNPRQEEREKEEGKVKKGISELAARMQSAGARTLGEYFSKLDPMQERIRQQWTGRQMFEDEFEAIWTAQAPHHPGVLTEDLRKKVHHAIFFQRPLKAQKHLIGECELEPGCKRAPIALLAAQRFRLLQKVNDLEVISADGQRRKLTPEERATLVEALEVERGLKFTGIRKRLKLAGHTFNFESDNEKGLIGNHTACDLAKVFGERWSALSPEEKDRVVEDLRGIQDRAALKRRGKTKWGLDEAAAVEFAKVALEDGYCRLSRKALVKVLPLLERGEQFARARKMLYGERPAASAVEALPRLEVALEVRNPAVERALTEVRKVVNGIVRQFGKPEWIRIELARDLKKPRKDRQQISQRNLENRSAREAARKRILEESGITNPRRADAEKLLLAEECWWQCPYTGKSISMSALFGPEPQFDVDHIIPFPRCLDNSFINKTLCYHDENVHRKGNHTPWEAYGSDPARWREIVARVRRFKSSAARAKVERFQMERLESLDDFTTRQLNDTKYASRLAVEYLAKLYGAGADGVAEGKRRVQAGRGQVTWFLRSEWGLNDILDGGTEEKRREDHRHHAIDAVVIALTEPRTVKMLSDAAQRAPEERRRRFGAVAPPWAGFADELRSMVDGLVVSHRVCRRVSGPLHKETYYSKAHADPAGRECVHVRKALGALSKQDLENIVDPWVRESVILKMMELDEADPGRAFKDPARHPTLRRKDGREIPIHSVRIRCYDVIRPVGEGARERRVILGSNHHMEILEVTDSKGRARWEGVVVPMYEALRRLRADQAVVQREHGPGKTFVFSLSGGEIIEIVQEDGTRGLCVVRDITQKATGYISIRFVSIRDARKKEDIQKRGGWGDSGVEPLRKMNCQKVVVTPLGEVRWARD